MPPQSAQRLGCRRRAHRLADRRALRSIADTQVSPQHSIMEDTSDKAVCQIKDFTILSLLRGSIIAVVISCRGDPLRVRTHAPHYVTYLRLRRKSRGHTRSRASCITLTRFPNSAETCGKWRRTRQKTSTEPMTCSRGIKSSRKRVHQVFVSEPLAHLHRTVISPRFSHVLLGRGLAYG